MKADELTMAERMQRLAENKPIDRVPVVAWASMYAARLAGISFKEMCTEPEKAFRTQALAAELHGYDEGPGYSYGWTNWIADELGGKVDYPDCDYGLPTVTVKPVNSLGDIEKLKFPAIGKGAITRHQLECARKNIAMGGMAVLHGIGLTGMVDSIIGNDCLMRWYYQEPNAIHTLYRKITDYYLDTIDFYVNEFGADNVTLLEGVPLDSQNVISPQTFEKFGFKYYREIHQRLVDDGVKSQHIHLCGNHTATLPLWKEIPIPKRSVISMGSEMDIKATAEYFGADYIIFGNVPTQILQFGTPEEVLEESRNIIDKMKHHPGGFILAPACGMPPATSPLNIHAMVKAAKTYGRYS